MDVLATKFAVLVLLIVIRVSSGIFPILVGKRFFGEADKTLQKKQIELAVACCLSFASGVLLATCFIHLAPETREIFSHSMPSHKLPITEILICAGFFLIFFIDEAILTFSEYSSQVSPIHGDETSLSISSKQLVTHSGPRRLLLALGLSCHSVIEGLALGFAESSANVWFLFVATSVHECIILFSISLHMVASKVKTAHILLFVIASSLVVPTGMLIGILSSSSGDSATVAVIQGLAAGTILYVIFYEVLTRDVREQCSGILSFLFAVFGFLIMLAVQLMGVYHHGVEDGVVCRGIVNLETQTSDYEEYQNKSKL